MLANPNPGVQTAPYHGANKTQGSELFTAGCPGRRMSVSGSRTEVAALERHVCSTLHNRHHPVAPSCPFRAKSSHFSKRFATREPSAPRCASPATPKRRTKKNKRRSTWDRLSFSFLSSLVTGTDTDRYSTHTVLRRTVPQLSRRPFRSRRLLCPPQHR